MDASQGGISIQDILDQRNKPNELFRHDGTINKNTYSVVLMWVPLKEHFVVTMDVGSTNFSMDFPFEDIELAKTTYNDLTSRQNICTMIEQSKKTSTGQ